MLNIKRIDSVSNATVHDLTQAAPLVENVRTRQLRILGHVLRLPDDESCKEYALYIPTHGKRKPGRQRTLFLTYIQHLLAATDNMIGPNKLSELAQDRYGWTKIVVACFAADRWWWWWWCWWWWWWWLLSNSISDHDWFSYSHLCKIVCKLHSSNSRGSKSPNDILLFM